jgi:hypothetical protein
MARMDVSEQCHRCGRVVSHDAPDYCGGESMSDDEGNVIYVCEGCVTPAELQAIVEDDMEFMESMKKDRERRRDLVEIAPGVTKLLEDSTLADIEAAQAMDMVTLARLSAAVERVSAEIAARQSTTV